MSAENNPPPPSAWDAYLATHAERADSQSAPFELITKPADVLATSDSTRNSQALGIIFENSYLTLVQDRVRALDGREFNYLRVLTGTRHPAGVAVLPITSENELILIEHYRHATGAWHWEIPRGFSEDAQTIDSAKRELLEELGVVPITMQALGRVHTNTGILDEVVEIFVAQLGDQAPTPTDPQESCMIRSIRAFPLAELYQLIRDGEIQDAFTLNAIVLAQANQQLGAEPS